MPYDAPVLPSRIVPPADLFDPGGGGGGFHHYRLFFKRHKVVSLIEWANWMERTPLAKLLGRQKKNGVRVSTVFLGLDHSFGRGGPLLYESMIFGGKRDQEQFRYRTYGEARTHFMRLCRTVFGKAPRYSRTYIYRPKLRVRRRIRYPFEHRIAMNKRPWKH